MVDLNGIINLLITTAKDFAATNTVTENNITRPMTEIEAVTLAGVRMIKLYSSYENLNERDILAALINRAQDRLYAMDRALEVAKNQVAQSNTEAVTEAFNAITLPE
jgi:hypothetical protein